MAANKGNQFWKLADYDKIGRPRNFKTPEDLWNACKPYFEECDNSPLLKEETTTTDKGNYFKTVEFKIPYTWQGLYVFLCVPDLKTYRDDEEFYTIITHIGNIIYNQKYSGAAAGLFNANIIARDLGLTDKKDITQKIDIEQITGMTLDESGD